jgi:hypothetical protein
MHGARLEKDGLCSTYLIKALQADRARYFGTVEDAASAGYSSALNRSLPIAPAVSPKYLQYSTPQYVSTY